MAQTIARAISSAGHLHQQPQNTGKATETGPGPRINKGQKCGAFSKSQSPRLDKDVCVCVCVCVCVRERERERERRGRLVCETIERHSEGKQR